MAKKRVVSKKATPVAKSTTVSKVNDEKLCKVEKKHAHNPLIALAQTVSFGVIILSLSFLIFGRDNNVVFAIPIIMGLILFGIVFGILINRREQP